MRKLEPEDFLRNCPADGKNVIMALLSIADIKHVVVTGDDIDVFDSIDVEGAVATCVQADRDVMIVANARSKPLDPSFPPPVGGKIPTTAKMGIDATISENVDRNRYNRIAYFNQDMVHLKDYLGAASEPAKSGNNGNPVETVDAMVEKIAAALEKSNRFFAELLELFPKAEYRTIATAVGQLHQDGKIAKDGEGK